MNTETKWANRLLIVAAVSGVIFVGWMFFAIIHTAIYDPNDFSRQNLKLWPLSLALFWSPESPRDYVRSFFALAPFATSTLAIGAGFLAMELRGEGVAVEREGGGGGQDTMGMAMGALLAFCVSIVLTGRLLVLLIMQ